MILFFINIIINQLIPFSKFRYNAADDDDDDDDDDDENNNDDNNDDDEMYLKINQINYLLLFCLFINHILS